VITARGLAIAEMPWVGGAQALVRFAPATAGGALPARTAARDFPTVEVASRLEVADDVVAVDSAAWRDGDADFYWIDAQADALGDRGLVPVATAGEPLIRLELLTRCQRWLDRRNRHSRAPWFNQLLHFHRSLFDRVQAGGRAQHNRGLDVWQWVLRLDPDASASLQAAALFASWGAQAGDILVGAPAPRPVVERAIHLVRSVSQAALPDHDDGEASALEDAGCLSFFAFTSASFLDDHGEAETRRAIAAILHRLSLRACTYLPQVRLRRDLARIFSEAATPR
jgi:hypothetical protein